MLRAYGSWIDTNHGSNVVGEDANYGCRTPTTTVVSEDTDDAVNLAE
jgi:hypothetical protein